MILTEDLRIGNWIIVSDVTYRINVIAETKVYFEGYKRSVKKEELQPIPITQEILEKSGFRRREKTNLYDKIPLEGFTYQLYADRMMIFHPGSNTLCHWLNTRITFLHQLQNLYYILTGRKISVSF
jgi:hypothetical protein